MDELERSLIVEFLTLNQKLEAMQNRIAKADHEFLQAHSFMGSTMAVDANGSRVIPKPWYAMVEDLVRTQQNIMDNIKIVTYERQQFNRYYETLTAEEQGQLERLLIRSNATLTVGLKQQTLAEIGQILEATSWRFGLAQDIHMEPVHDASESVANMLSLFEVM